ncbi:putative membrane protein [Rossellomorea marisflavi]
MSNLIVRIFGGFGVGGVLTVLVLAFGIDPSADIDVREIMFSLLGSMITGAYFSVAAMVFTIDNWSMMKQIAVHYTSSLVILFPVFTWLTGWIAIDPAQLLPGLVIFTGIYVFNWLGWYLYYKQIEKKMNESIRNKS